MKKELTDSLKHTARLFRIGNIGAANQSLVNSIDSLNSYLNQSEYELPEQVQRVSLEALEAQQRQDYLFLADILEYQLLNLLDR